MPTGYTAPIEEQNIGARDFALRCARAFGAFISQREDSLNENPKLPEVNVPEYRQDWLNRDIKMLENLQSMTQGKIREEHQQYLKETKESNLKARARYDDKLKKYNKVKEKIEAWNPNKESVGLKEFCLDQIAISLPFYPHLFELQQSPEKWHQERVDLTKESIAMERKSIKEDYDRQVEKRRVAIKMLESIEDIKD